MSGLGNNDNNPKEKKTLGKWHPRKLRGKKRKLQIDNTSGYTGVSKVKKRYQASIKVNRKQKYLGRYDTSKEAALAYDRAIVKYKHSRSKMNFPNGLPVDDVDYADLMNPRKKRSVRSKTGYNGVYKRGKRYLAQIAIDRKRRSLGTFATARDAAEAFDQAVIKNKQKSSRLNFPNDDYASSSSEEEEEEESDEEESDEEESDGKKSGEQRDGKSDAKKNGKRSDGKSDCNLDEIALQALQALQSPAAAALPHQVQSFSMLDQLAAVADKQ